MSAVAKKMVLPKELALVHTQAKAQSTQQVGTPPLTSRPGGLWNHCARRRSLVIAAWPEYECKASSRQLSSRRACVLELNSGEYTPGYLKRTTSQLAMAPTYSPAGCSGYRALATSLSAFVPVPELAQPRFPVIFAPHLPIPASLGSWTCRRRFAPAVRARREFPWLQS